jgi:SAM-dependent methyltransferase
VRTQLSILAFPGIREKAAAARPCARGAIQPMNGYDIYWWSQPRIVPGLRPSQYAYTDRLTAAVRPGLAWLDVGCGRRPVPAWMPAEMQTALLRRTDLAFGVDMDFPSLVDNDVLRGRVQASAGSLPFATAAFDVVSANMVVEHLERPSAILTEIRRVLRPGGRFVFHTPNRRFWAIGLARVVPERVKLSLVRLLEGRAATDVFPTWYRFNEAGDIRRLAATAGFEVEHLEHISSSAVTAALGPVAWPELVVIRLMRRPSFARWRSNLIGVLRAR